MKNVKGTIYQLNKEGDKTTFEYNFKTEIANDKVSQFDKLSGYMAAKLFAAKQLNDVFAAKKQRRLGLAKTKPLYFFLEIDGQTIFANEIEESVKLTISLKNSTQEDIQEVLEACMTFANQDIKL